MSVKVGIQFDIQNFIKSVQDILTQAKTAEQKISDTVKIKPEMDATQVKRGIAEIEAELADATNKMQIYAQQVAGGSKMFSGNLKEVYAEIRRLNAELANLKRGADTTSKSITNIAAETKKAAEETKLFREKKLNLGADLVIISYGFKQVAGDIKNLTTELNKGEKSTGAIGGAVAEATISILAMIPAVKALGGGLRGLVGDANFMRLGVVGAVIATIYAISQLSSWRNKLSGMSDGLDLNDPENQKKVTDAELRSKALQKLNDQFKTNYTSEKLKGNKNLPFDEEDIKIQMGIIKLQEQGKEIKQKEVDLNEKLKSSGSGSHEAHKEEIKLLNTEQEILEQIAEIEKKLAIETLPLQSREFKKQIDLLQEKIKYLRGDFEKIDLSGFDAKELPGINISSRSDRGDNSEGKAFRFKETIAELRAELIAFASVEGIVSGIANSFGGLFAAFTPPQGADSPLKQFLKSVITSMITAAQGAILAATAFSTASGIFSFGLTLLKDAPLLAAALVALEAAKGFISGFKIGGYTGDGDENEVAGTVHKGEFVIRKARVGELVRNFGTGFLSFLNGGGLVPNISNSYASGGIVNALSSKPSGDFFEANISGEFTEAMKIDFYKNGKKLTSQENNAIRLKN